MDIVGLLLFDWIVNIQNRILTIHSWLKRAKQMNQRKSIFGSLHDPVSQFTNQSRKESAIVRHDGDIRHLNHCDIYAMCSDSI
jgi:hypothetical protein